MLRDGEMGWRKTVNRMALITSATRSPAGKLAAVIIGMAIGAATKVGDFYRLTGSVAFCARHVLMLPEQRKPGARVIKDRRVNG